ncbi:hypothetical protein F5B18DRAFT_230411 [Nemania serpens]|nr:hypothetical protein F5B18DRAFT_230411 [Nemania serpens]
MILGPLAPVIHIHSSVPVCTKVGTAWSSYYLEYQPTIYFSNNNNNSSSSRHTSESDVIDLDQSTSCSPLFSRSFRLNKIGLITPGVYFIYLHRNQVVVCGRGTAVTHFGFPCFAPSTQQLTLPIPWQYRYSRIATYLPGMGKLCHTRTIFQMPDIVTLSLEDIESMKLNDRLLSLVQHKSRHLLVMHRTGIVQNIIQVFKELTEPNCFNASLSNSAEHQLRGGCEIPCPQFIFMV